MEITRADTWEAVRAAHRWEIPRDYSLAWDLCEKWAATEPDRLALIHVSDVVREYTFRDLSRLSARLANVLTAHGIVPGDRIAVLLPQAPETILCHLAAYRLGVILMPLFTLFGADGLKFRLSDSGAKAVITDHDNLPKMTEIRGDLPALGHIWCIEGPADGAAGLPQVMEKASDHCPLAPATPDTPAFLTYTSGTTGPPKGALHGQKVVPGHVPGCQLFYDFWPQKGDRIWTPSDWAWLGGLGNVALPSLRFGVPLIAHTPRKFDPDAAYDLMVRQKVTSAFLAPTALKMMRQAVPPCDLPLRAVGSGGESLGAAMLDWGRETLGLTINEFYGQTECNLVLGNNSRLFEPRPGSMGKEIPGSHVRILRPDNTIADPDETGEIALRRGDAAMFLGYWNLPEKTAEKFVTADDGHDYMLTGDEGRVDTDGYFWFASRTDDVITTAGYRVGPSEIEDCLNRHPAVAMSACIGVPDELRTEIVRAHVVLADGRNGAPELADELIAYVRERLSPHVAPREVRWIDALPMTATGKIRRRDLKEQP
ncbi:MAG: AMP-binding protein [Paracoccaceae bacterium]